MNDTQDARRIRVIDSHTEGEPTRVVIAGGPDLGSGDAATRLGVMRRDHDRFRSAVVNEPRGFDAMVGALLAEPANPGAVAQVIFFNNVGYLGMCVHGTIGVARTLQWMGVIGPGTHRLETPVGDVGITLHEDGLVDVENVLSYRTEAAVTVQTRDHGPVTGDVAWGGNWFFLVADHGLELDLAGLERLTDYCQQVREALAAAGITGSDGAEVDHVELFGAPSSGATDSRNFVLCPGREYDRSPCGTGTSAKMACLWADGALQAGEPWRQESILGSRFVGTVRAAEGGVIPTVSGRAWITAESTLLLQPTDPFAEGIRR